MRVLIAHSRYASGSVSGENRVVEDEARLLADAGHEICLWTPSAAGIGGVRAVAAGAQAVWSQRAACTLRALARDAGADVVHVHNLFPLLSPAAIRSAAAEAPVVVTLHNYRLLCLPATLVRGGARCSVCVGRIPWRGVVHRCYRGSAAASAALAASLTLHRALRSFERVRLFLAVSELVREQHLAAGLEPTRIRVKANFAWPGERRRRAGDYFLFLGRLTAERGIDVLLDAWRDVSAPLVVAGDGPAAESRARWPTNVTYLGRLEPGAVPSVLAGARALVFPTVAAEGAPRAIVEAFAAGVPVLATDSGAVSEFVEDGVSGVLVRKLDASTLRAAVERLLDDREAVRMGEAAWRSWRDRYSPARALAELESAYEWARAC
jgi:glycosyltransferase involved in cell wall biosynthesis